MNCGPVLLQGFYTVDSKQAAPIEEFADSPGLRSPACHGLRLQDEHKISYFNTFGSMADTNADCDHLLLAAAADVSAVLVSCPDSLPKSFPFLPQRHRGFQGRGPAWQSFRQIVQASRRDQTMCEKPRSRFFT